MTTRVLAPAVLAPGAYPFLAVNGMGFTAFPGKDLDVPDCYAPAFVAKGWTIVCHVGPDDERPWPIQVQP
jgi:hypothetical protein